MKLFAISSVVLALGTGAAAAHATNTVETVLELRQDMCALDKELVLDWARHTRMMGSYAVATMPHGQPENCANPLFAGAGLSSNPASREEADMQALNDCNRANAGNLAVGPCTVIGRLRLKQP